jgi:hypothetical protein
MVIAEWRIARSSSLYATRARMTTPQCFPVTRGSCLSAIVYPSRFRQEPRFTAGEKKGSDEITNFSI